MIKEIRHKIKRSVKLSGRASRLKPLRHLRFPENKFVRGWLPVLAVIALATTIFILRNKALLDEPNFYAEDAVLFLNNVYTNNPIDTLLTPFNGYLLVGLYLLSYAAAAINMLFGNDVIDLAIVTFIVSSAFLGLVAALPYILFRKQLGAWLAVVLVILTSLVPMYGFDYAIIGTIGNLKFAFLYVALLLIVFRVYNAQVLKTRHFITIDVLLLLCVLTNVTVAFLVPLLLLPYAGRLLAAARTRKLRLELPIISALVLISLSVIYVAVALLRGIPDMPGYLDGPFDKSAILPIIERSTTFALLYPITHTFNGYLVGGLLAAGLVLLAAVLWRKPDQRFILFAAAWAVAVGTGLFVVNRPGVGEFFMTYAHKGGPDQFFYAQNMIFIFAVGWLLKDSIKKLRPGHLVTGTVLVALYLIWAVPFGSSFGDSKTVYQYLQPIRPNIERACEIYAGKPEVIVQIYPSPAWQWRVDKELACNY